MQEGYKECSCCGRLLLKKYTKNICPSCEEAELFSKVKDFIRNNTVNEFQVAEHFNISLKKVKEWIKEGRIEYCLSVSDEENKYSSVSCQICGKKISFGTLCTECQRLTNGNKGYINLDKDKDKMRFFR